MKYLGLLIVLFLPTTAFASVTITEVAWMGSAASANHEWIELYNSGLEVDVTGWSISDGLNLEIPLQGIMPSGEFAVLERTSDASTVGNAFLVYTGAFVNGGATLTLSDASGAVIDRVVGGDDWSNIGGDNKTKETAQKGSNGWVTGTATPGSGTLNGSAATEVIAEAKPKDLIVFDSTTKIKKSSSQSESIVLTLPDVTLQLDIEAPTFAYVNQPIELTVEPSGIGDTLLDSLTYTWSFGDGNSGTGRELVHEYSHPGRYVLVVQGGYSRQQQVARYEIDVFVPEVVISQTAEAVVVTNEGLHEIDLGGHRLFGQQIFTLPPYTILLPGQRILIPKNKLGIEKTQATVALFDQSRRIVASDVPAVRSAVAADLAQVARVDFNEPVVTRATTENILASAERTESLSSTRSERFKFASAASTTAVQKEIPKLLLGNVAMAADDFSTTTQLAEVAQIAKDMPTRWPLYTLMGIILLGILSIYLIPSYPRGEGLK